MSLWLSRSFEIVNVEYPKLGEVLASFNSILNLLLIIGFLGNIYSKSENFNLFIKIFMNIYYKLDKNY